MQLRWKRDVAVSKHCICTDDTQDNDGAYLVQSALHRSVGNNSVVEPQASPSAPLQSSPPQAHLKPRCSCERKRLQSSKGVVRVRTLFISASFLSTVHVLNEQPHSSLKAVHRTRK
jgi:hypothetical protein